MMGFPQKQDGRDTRDGMTTMALAVGASAGSLYEKRREMIARRGKMVMRVLEGVCMCVVGCVITSDERSEGR